MAYNQLQIREVFHIEFLRWFGRKVKAELYAVKGGVNLRLFYRSFRYSEDMDLDIRGVGVHALKEYTVNILKSQPFQDNLKTFGIGIRGITAPDMAKAKQTETTQRFKIHLIANSGEDLFTKIEFSRRGFAGTAVVNAIDDAILRTYRLAPVLVPHYDVNSAIMQKVRALATRSTVQARDIFDLFILSSQCVDAADLAEVFSGDMISTAHGRIFEIGFEQFHDTVISYLSAEDQAVYSNAGSWEEIQLKTAKFIETMGKPNA